MMKSKVNRRIISFILCFALLMPYGPSTLLQTLSSYITESHAAVNMTFEVTPASTEWYSVDSKNRTITILNRSQLANIQFSATVRGTMDDPVDPEAPPIDISQADGEVRWSVSNMEVMSLSADVGWDNTFDVINFGTCNVTATFEPITAGLSRQSVTWKVNIPIYLISNAPSIWGDWFDSSWDHKPFTDVFHVPPDVNLPYGSLEWTSDNSSVIECPRIAGEAPELYRRGGGKANISASSSDKTQSLTVTVYVPIRIFNRESNDDDPESLDKLVTITANLENNTVRSLVPLTSNSIANENYEINVQDPTRNIYWYSSNPTVASVTSPGGRVTPLAAGFATISAQANEHATSFSEATDDSYRVQVPLRLYTSPQVGSPELIGAAYGMTVNDSIKVGTNVAQGSTNFITWENSNSQVVSLDQSARDGTINIKALKNGTAVIKGTYNDPRYSAGETMTVTCTITVGNYMYLNKNSMTMTEGNSTDLFAITSATDGEYEWSSSNLDIATVEPDPDDPTRAIVTAVKAGVPVPGKVDSDIAVITLTHRLNGIVKSITCKVRVTVPAAEVTIAGAPTSPIEIGKVIGVSAVFNPIDTTNQDVVWSSSNPNVLEISPNGTACLVKALAVGKASIVVASVDGTILASCTIIVHVPFTHIVLPEKYRNITIEEGISIQLFPYVLPETATKPKFRFLSSDRDGAVLEVDEDTGLITAIAPGYATVTVLSANGGNYEPAYCNITVGIPVTKITATPQNATIWKGNSIRITSVITPSDATDQEIAWSTNNPKVATVDQTGKVTGVAGGTCKIKVRTSDGAYRTDVNITVKEYVSKITLNYSSLDIGRSRNRQLKASVTAATATNRKVTWTSSNRNIVTVSSTGQITSKNRVGSATITCTAADGSGKKATCRVSVVIPVTRIKLNYNQMKVLTGKKYTLRATISPTNATKKSVTWSSSNPSVASINIYGVVDVLTPGKTTITCTAKDGSGKKAICYIDSADPIPATSIKLNISSITMVKGGTTQLRATMLPRNNNDAYRFFTEDRSVASVTSNGFVTATGPGTTNVYATALDSGVTANVTVNVIGLSNYQISIFEYESFNLSVDGATVPIYWSTSNNQVANVSTTGRVTGRKQGTCYITAKVGHNTLRCRVTIRGLR